MTGFDDKAEIEEFELRAQKLTLASARRHFWWLAGMWRLWSVAAKS